MLFLKKSIIIYNCYSSSYYYYYYLFFLSSEQENAKTGLLMVILSLIFMNGNVMQDGEFSHKTFSVCHLDTPDMSL